MAVGYMAVQMMQGGGFSLSKTGVPKIETPENWSKAATHFVRNSSYAGTEELLKVRTTKNHPGREGKLRIIV